MSTRIDLKYSIYTAIYCPEIILVCPRLEAEIEEAHLKAKEEMMQGIQMAKEVAQKELSEQKALYEDRIQSLEKELVH